MTYTKPQLDRRPIVGLMNATSPCSDPKQLCGGAVIEL